ncbi:hypothetical protein [Caldisphaera sp.]|uniref:hypothetical protein n=1 Tax=Caldisphaera sp. TaxID=2060322 RepID=UPI003D0D194C
MDNIKPFKVILNVFIFFIIVYLIISLFYPLIIKQSTVYGKASYYLTSIIIGEILGFTLFYYLIRKDKMSLRDIGLKFNKKYLAYLLGIIIAIVYAGVELQIPEVYLHSFEIDKVKLLAVIAAIVAGFVEKLFSEAI